MQKIFLPLLLVAFSPVVHNGGVQGVRIDASLSGWHPTESEDASFSQSTNYPVSSVSMANDQDVSTRIHGKVKNCATAGKVQQGRLVASGASIPQRTESDGSSAHPYIFIEGSNNVQVISPDGQGRQKMRFYPTPGTETIRTHLWLTLSWDTDSTDLDFHVVTSGGEHVRYGNTALKNSNALGIDVTTGYGLETFVMSAPIHGRYQVYINYYGECSGTELITAQLALTTDEGLVNEKQETFIVPVRNAGKLTLVKNFDW